MREPRHTDSKPIRREESYPKLISLAVHEFRTPASVVGGYLRMLQRDEELSERQRKMIDEAAKSCARLVELITELSDLGKLDAGVTLLSHQPIDLFPLVHEVAAGINEAQDRQVRLEVRGPAAGAPLKADPARLRAALGAVFRAIVREKPSTTTVVAERRVETRKRGRSAVLIIADDATVQTAYEAEPTAFDEGRGGLGLTLPIARRIIEAHGGRLWSPASPNDHQTRGAAIVSLPLE